MVDHPTQIFYNSVDWKAKRREKFEYIEKAGNVLGIDWKEITPNTDNLWLTEGMEAEFDTFLPIGTQEAKAGEGEAIFENYSNGVKTHRDVWAYNFDRASVAKNIHRTIETYNQHVYRWERLAQKPNVDEFVSNNQREISWSASLKSYLQSPITLLFDASHIRDACYRPFTRMRFYFDHHLNERRYQFPYFFPTESSEKENRVICVPGTGNRKQFSVLATDRIPALDLAFEKAQCFPFYTYAEDGSNRQENITDWALAQFRSHYADESIDKWAIFHFVYALLHHPRYREKYAANLRRSLPRIPFAPDFWSFAQAGKRLAELHVNYEEQPEYPLQWVENPAAAMSFRVEKMKLSRDKSSLQYNNFLTLTGIPPAVFDYKLGNRAALEWVIERYQITTDKRSSIVNDPNAYSDNPQYIVQLIGKVVTVSVETVAIVAGLLDLGV